MDSADASPDPSPDDWYDDFDGPDLDTGGVAAALPAGLELTRGERRVVADRGLAA